MRTTTCAAAQRPEMRSLFNKFRGYERKEQLPVLNGDYLQSLLRHIQRQCMPASRESCAKFILKELASTSMASWKAQGLSGLQRDHRYREFLLLADYVSASLLCFFCLEAATFGLRMCSCKSTGYVIVLVKSPSLALDLSMLQIHLLLADQLQSCWDRYDLSIALHMCCSLRQPIRDHQSLLTEELF